MNTLSRQEQINQVKPTVILNRKGVDNNLVQAVDRIE